MIQTRRSQERGRTQIDWLDSYHTFSFNEYYDPRYVSFRTLRVINEDWVKPGAGFGIHPHCDMEIITVLLEGALEHKDSLGNGGVIITGEVQRMTAGTGIVHSEFNASSSDPVHLLQIWIYPGEKGLEPSYEQRRFEDEGKRGRLRLLASGNGAAGAVQVHQDVDLYDSHLETGEQATHTLAPGRHAWLQVARGAVKLNGQPLRAGDGAAVSEEKSLEISAEHPSELLLFDLS